MSDPTEGLDLWLATIKKQIEDFAAESRLSDSAQDSALSQLAKVVEHQESEISLLKLALGELEARVVALEGFKQPNRESLVPGDYIPGEATTGSYGELLKRVGNLTTTKDGEVFEGLYIEGQITINHSVTFKRCHIKGATPTAASYAVVRCYKALAKPAQMIDCTIEATPHQWSAVCVQGRDIELIRCNIFGAVDGVMATNSGLKVIASWIHDLHWNATGHKDGGPTHNDDIQIEGGGGHEIVGNCLEVGSRCNAGVMVTQNVAPIIGLLMKANWFFSSEITKELQPPVAINMTASGKAAMTGVEITNNRFSNQNMWRDNRAAWIDSATLMTAYVADKMRNNEYLDGTPAKLSRG